MSAAHDLYAYLVTQQGYSGAPVFVGGLPETPDLAVTVIPFGGPPPILAMGQHNVVERVTYLQVLVRGAPGGYAGAETVAEALWQLCRHALGVTVGAVYYDRIVAVSEPTSVTPTGNGRPLLSFTVEAWKRGS